VVPVMRRFVLMMMLLADVATGKAGRGARPIDVGSPARGVKDRRAQGIYAD